MTLDLEENNREKTHGVLIHTKAELWTTKMRMRRTDDDPDSESCHANTGDDVIKPSDAGQKWHS